VRAHRCTHGVQREGTAREVRAVCENKDDGRAGSGGQRVTHQLSARQFELSRVMLQPLSVASVRAHITAPTHQHLTGLDARGYEPEVVCLQESGEWRGWCRLR
jgi:hypothetical protein